MIIKFFGLAATNTEITQNSEIFFPFEFISDAPISINYRIGTVIDVYNRIHKITKRNSYTINTILIILVLLSTGKAEYLTNLSLLTDFFSLFTAELVEEDTKMCGKILTVLSWVIVILTMPFSLFVCFKVRRYLGI